MSAPIPYVTPFVLAALVLAAAVLVDVCEAVATVVVAFIVALPVWVIDAAEPVVVAEAADPVPVLNVTDAAAVNEETLSVTPCSAQKETAN